MDVRIGVIHTAKEIEIELAPDADREAIHAQIEEVLADEQRTLWLVDRYGAEFAVPAGKVAYVQIGRSDSDRRIGFGA